MQVECESCKNKYEESFDYEHIADYNLMMCNKCVGCESYEEVENLIINSGNGNRPLLIKEAIRNSENTSSS